MSREGWVGGWVGKLWSGELEVGREGCLDDKRSVNRKDKAPLYIAIGNLFL